MVYSQMDSEQKVRALDLLRSGLSQQGYLTAQQIMEVEGILGVLEGEGRRFSRDQEGYWVSVFGSLDASQRERAIFDDVAPENIVTGADLVVNPLEPIGIPGSALSSRQRDLLMAVIDSYVGIMADDIAALRRAAVERGGLDDTWFAWAGPMERGEVAYYRVQGPEFLIEFDNTQEDPNHIHAAYRDFDGDLGRDVLREHVALAH